MIVRGFDCARCGTRHYLPTTPEGRACWHDGGALEVVACLLCGHRFDPNTAPKGEPPAEAR